ncbi:unnamed protein product [Prunus armeniaca]
MIWEAMNKDYDKGKSRKLARMAKKAVPAKKPEKAVKVSTVMDTKNRLSSKINYEALDNLNEELVRIFYMSYFRINFALFMLCKSRIMFCQHPRVMHLHLRKAQSLIVAVLVICNYPNEKNSRKEAEARQGQDDDSYVANDKYNGYN